ncbi:MAG TPA: response regulator transcription factor [Verrucomicrobia bacterium]|nr:response regulator transcription factor [Verrucomicrobiales bacterium]HIL53714.1 response regulator transcription factor [Verrucomicrobiota bacterium]
MRVLIAEDDQHTRDGLSEIFDAEGYKVYAASDGVEALQLFAKFNPDVVCLDVMMPGASGYDVCREIRSIDPEVGILFISAKSEEIDKVLGLELGADDFIVKPFGLKEVVARIRAVTRRLIIERKKKSRTGSDEDDNGLFEMGDLKVLPEELRAYRGDEPVELSLRDVKILSLLYRNRGKVVSRDTFFDECWNFDFIPNSRCLDQHISQLRRRVERDPGRPKLISTVHGVGYRFE